jgi:hypothetical protein
VENPLKRDAPDDCRIFVVPAKVVDAAVLKTENLSDDRHIDEFEAVIMLIRAISKFTARYDESSHEMEEFVVWCRAHNYTPK